MNSNFFLRATRESTYPGRCITICLHEICDFFFVVFSCGTLLRTGSLERKAEMETLVRVICGGSTSGKVEEGKQDRRRIEKLSKDVASARAQLQADSQGAQEPVYTADSITRKARGQPCVSHQMVIG